MGKVRYSRKMPDRRRNKELAGKTVYTCGMNVVYDKLGYPTKSWNPNHKLYAGTTRSVPAQPIEEALAGMDWVPPYRPDLKEWDPSYTE